MANAGSNALAIKKFDTLHTHYVKYDRHLHLPTDIGGNRVRVTFATTKIYDFELALKPESTGTYLIELIPLSVLDDEQKNWVVSFSICQPSGIVDEEHTAFFNVQSWIARGFVHVRHSGIFASLLSLYIKCTIKLRASETKSGPRKIDFKVPSCRALDDIGGTFDDGKFTDVTINACGKKLRAHKVILAARSSVFSAMFDNEMSEQIQNEVNITDMDSEVITEILRFIYTGKAPNITNKTGDLLAAADKYDLPRLKLMCEEELAKSITVENAAETLKIADLHSAEALTASAIDFIKLHAKDVINTTEYQSMVPSHPHLIDELFRSLVMS